MAGGYIQTRSGKIQKTSFANAQQLVCFSCFATSSLDQVIWEKLWNSTGDDNHEDLVPFGSMTSHHAAAAEHFVVRVRSNHRDSHGMS